MAEQSEASRSPGESLAALLRNRFYIGEVRYKGEVFPGEQPAILDRALFEAVQAKLDQQRTNHAKARQKSQSLLTGRIFDAHGNRMTPSHAVKNGVRYRYYISSALIQGQPDKAATLNRVPAAEIETLIISALRKHLAGKSNNKREEQGSHSLNDKDLISTHIVRVDVKPDHLAVQLSVRPDHRGGERQQELSREGGTPDHKTSTIMVVPWRKMPSKRPREIILPAGTSSHQDLRPIRAETRARLVIAIAKGRANHFLYLVKASHLLVAAGGNLAEGLKKIEAPVLLITSDDDLIFPPRRCEPDRADDQGGWHAGRAHQD